MDEETFAFGTFRLIPAQRVLLDDGKPLRLGSRALDILITLVEHAGRTISKEQLIAHTWPDTVVDDGALRVHVAALRKALGDGRAGRRYVANNPGRGYAFVAPVTREHPPPATDLPNRASEGNDLPAPLTRIVGRADVIAALAVQLARRRFLTIVGPGGIGKTTVAVAVAGAARASYKDGIWFVGLASLSEPDLVSSAVCAVLGIGLSGVNPLSELTAWLQGKHILIVLDSCEHVIGAAATLAEAILKAAPQAGILATSREPLRAEGEWLHRLAPLELPPQATTSPTATEALSYSAVELFNERATAIMDGFVLDDADVPVVLEICRRLDGVPLALELAAARVDTFGVGGLAAQLDDRFGVLTSGRRTALPRQQTLRATIDWSYDLLPEVEQVVLRRLALFRGAFTINAAAAVTIDERITAADAVEGIANLAEKSLITTDITGNITYHSLLDTTRLYALEKLAKSGEIDSVQRRHASYFRDALALPASGSRSGLSNEELTGRIREIDNVRAALDWSFSPPGDIAIGVDLTAAYAPVWRHLSLMAECRERCERALIGFEVSGIPNTRVQMRLQIALGSALVATMAPAEQTKTVLTKALELANVLGDLEAQADALRSLQGVLVYRGEYGRARRVAEQLQQIAHRIGDPALVAVADRLMGNTLLTLGRPREAQQCLERVLRSSVPVEDQRLTISKQSDDRAMARAMLARALWLQGFAEKARSQAEAGLEELRGPDYRLSFCRVLYFGFCRILPMTGDFAAAERAIARMIEVATGFNAPFWQTAGRFLEGKLAVERGEFAQGAAVLRDAFDTCGRTGWRISYPEFRGALAQALAGLGQLDDALSAVNEAVASAGQGENGQVWYVPELLRIKGDVLLRHAGDRSAATAEDCFDEAGEMAREQGALFWELRVALSFARLRVTQSRHDEARRILAPICDRFTEGFAIPDLRAARSILDAPPS